MSKIDEDAEAYRAQRAEKARLMGKHDRPLVFGGKYCDCGCIEGYEARQELRKKMKQEADSHESM